MDLRSARSSSSTDACKCPAALSKSGSLGTLLGRLKPVRGARLGCFLCFRTRLVIEAHSVLVLPKNSIRILCGGEPQARAGPWAGQESDRPLMINTLEMHCQKSLISHQRMPANVKATHSCQSTTATHSMAPLSAAVATLILSVSPLDIPPAHAQEISPPPSSTGVKRFEPRIDTSALVSESITILVIGASAAYWWLVIVPSERAALASSKRSGPVRKYLEELRPAANGDGDGAGSPSTEDRSIERWFYTDYMKQPWFKTPKQVEQTPEDVSSDRGRGVEGWRELLKPTISTPTPKFWSLDNPIVASLALIMAGGVVSELIGKAFNQ